MSQEVLVNDSSYNIHRGRIAALKALMKYISEGLDSSEKLYVPDISPDDQRLDDLAMTAYHHIRTSWMAMYEHWKYPELFIIVQFDNNEFYTQVHKHVFCDSDHSQPKLF